MAKDIITELIEELQQLKDDELKRVARAIEEGKNPPIPLTPVTVMKKVYEVARHHQVTPEELGTMMEMQENFTLGKDIVDDYAKKLETEE